MSSYFYSQHGQQHGPISSAELRRLATTGQLAPDAQVWAEGTTKRVLAKDIQGLFVSKVEPAEPPPQINTTSTAVDLPFPQYWRRHFVATRGPWAFGICLGLIAIPALSLLKPVIGFKGLAITPAVVALLSLLFISIHSLQRAVAYFLQRQRTVPDRARSRMAALAFTGLLLCVMITPFVGAEFFTPRCGLLAALMPQLREVQAPIIPSNEVQPNESSDSAPETAPIIVDDFFPPTQDGPTSNATGADGTTLDPDDTPPSVSLAHTASDFKPVEHRTEENQAMKPETRAEMADSATPEDNRPFPATRPLRKNYVEFVPIENWDRILDPILQAVRTKPSGRANDERKRAERIEQLVRKLSGTVSFASYVAYIDKDRMLLDLGVIEVNAQTIHNLRVEIDIVHTWHANDFAEREQLGIEDAIKIDTLKSETGSLRRGDRVLVTGQIERSYMNTSGEIVMVVKPTSIVPLDDLYYPPQDPLDRDNLINTAMALTHMAHEVSLAGKGGNELRAQPFADLMARKLRAMTGRQVAWLGRIRRITAERILLADRCIEGDRLFMDLDKEFSGCRVRVLSGETREVSEGRSVPMDLVSPAVARSLSAEDTVRLAGRIRAIDPGPHEVIIRVTVTDLEKTNDDDFGDLNRDGE